MAKLWRKGNFSKSLVGILFLLSKHDKIISISLSLLKIGEKNIKFLFLFSIGLFGLSSMTARFSSSSVHSSGSPTPPISYPDVSSTFTISPTTIPLLFLLQA